MKVTAIWFGLVTLLVGGGLVLAQDYYGGYVVNRASTPGESYARGFADVVRSQGQYNLATSEAAINMTEARKNDIENREKWTNTYFEMRQANKAYRAAERRPAPSMEDLVRHAQAGLPDRLSPSELDSVTGKISWPIVLRTDRYGQYRSELEGLFSKRANEGVINLEDYMQIDATVKAMLAELKKQIREVPSSTWVAAKRFLEGLGYEARLSAT